MVRDCGPGSFLAKLDIKNAFRICPVRKDDWWLLCFEWGGKYYVYVKLPFGGRSSPGIFNNFADLLCWVFQFVRKISTCDHYLDDYIFVGKNKALCGFYLREAISTCTLLGVPLALEKVEGPATSITYLGIEIDSVSFSLRLPEEKLAKLKGLLPCWYVGREVTKRELLSLIGFLSFACKVIKPGRIFLRRLIDLSVTVDSLEGVIVVTPASVLDIEWWAKFVDTWNGRESILTTPVTSISLGLFTDASNVGFGGVMGGCWFSERWDVSCTTLHINVKELFAIVAAVFTWGASWADMDLVIYTDNKPITQIWSSGSTKNGTIMFLIRTLFLYIAKRNVNIRLEHVFGYSNVKADLLSRLQVTEFLRKYPDMEMTKTVLDERVWDILRACTDLS